VEKTLARESYIDRDIFIKERDILFYRQWATVGREEDVPNPGDYSLINFIGQSILLVRGDDNKIRAFYNVCRHRGSELIDSTSKDALCGHFRKNIRCPYHSWSYKTDGSLNNTPHIDVSDEGDLSLYSIALDCWAGFVFIKLHNEDGIGLLEQLESAMYSVPESIKRYELQNLVTGKTIRYDVKANWKVFFENYNECYHCGNIHPELCKLVPSFRSNGGDNLDWDKGVPHRPGANTFTLTGTSNRPPFPKLNQNEIDNHFGQLAYPNFGVSLSNDHASVYIIWPTGPETMIIENRFLFHPEAVAASDYDPSDAVDFWDMVNRQDWGVCERVQRGMHALPFKHGYYAPMEDVSLDMREYVTRHIPETKFIK